MKVFLCGGGCGTQTAEATRLFCDTADRGRPLLYIPLAMTKEHYPDCLEWIKNELGSYGMSDIHMVTSAEELSMTVLDDFGGIFIGGGNTYRLLKILKSCGAFDSIREYIGSGGAVFGASAGAVIFGRDLCACNDENTVGLSDTRGYDMLYGISIACHYSGCGEKNRANNERLLTLSESARIMALPEEDTIFINDGIARVIGDRPFYYFENGIREERMPKRR